MTALATQRWLPAALVKRALADAASPVARTAAEQRRSEPMTRASLRVLIALAVSTATLSFTTASAHAGWSSTAPPSRGCGSSISAPHYPNMTIQSCVVVADRAGGAWVQGVTGVSNLSDNPTHSINPTGYASVYLSGQPFRADNCGSTVIAGGQEKWCWGATKWAPGDGRPVVSYGFAWIGSGIHDRAVSRQLTT